MHPSHRYVEAAIGRPRSGDVNANRVKCKLRYINAMKEAASVAGGIFNDNLFDHLCKKTTLGFANVSVCET